MSQQKLVIRAQFFAPSPKFWRTRNLIRMAMWVFRGVGKLRGEVKSLRHSLKSIAPKTQLFGTCSDDLYSNCWKLKHHRAPYSHGKKCSAQFGGWTHLRSDMPKQHWHHLLRRSDSVLLSQARCGSKTEPRSVLLPMSVSVWALPKPPQTKTLKPLAHLFVTSLTTSGVTTAARCLKTPTLYVLDRWTIVEIHENQQGHTLYNKAQTSWDITLIWRNKKRHTANSGPPRLRGHQTDAFEAVVGPENQAQWGAKPRDQLPQPWQWSDGDFDWLTSSSFRQDCRDKIVIRDFLVANNPFYAICDFWNLVR